MITLSSKLSKVVSNEAMDCINGELHLQKTDMEALTKVLNEKEDTNQSINRKRAVNAFIQVANDKEFSSTLEKILQDSTEEDATRIAAASGLGKYGDKKSEKTLIKVISETSGHLQREVIKALGRIGTEKSLQAFAKLSKNREPGMAQTLSFAKTLISYRNDDITIEPEDIKNSLGGQWVTQKPDKLTKKQLQAGIPTLGANTYGIKLSDNIGYEISCGNITNTLFMSNEFKSGKILNNLNNKSQIAGIVAIRNPKEVISTVRHIVLTNPTKTGADILITRTSGELVYMGEVKMDGKVTRFTIRDIGNTARPTAISGTISEDEIEFDISTVSKHRAKSGQKI